MRSRCEVAFEACQWLIFVIACLTNLIRLFPSTVLNDAEPKVVARPDVYQVSAAIKSRGDLVTVRDSYGSDELALDEITSQALQFASPCDFQVSLLFVKMNLTTNRSCRLSLSNKMLAMHQNCFEPLL
jgi:hypothetical protein